MDSEQEETAKRLNKDIADANVMCYLRRQDNRTALF
jgi:hypothetical protein